MKRTIVENTYKGVTSRSVVTRDARHVHGVELQKLENVLRREVKKFTASAENIADFEEGRRLSDDTWMKTVDLIEVRHNITLAIERLDRWLPRNPEPAQALVDLAEWADVESLDRDIERDWWHDAANWGVVSTGNYMSRRALILDALKVLRSEKNGLWVRPAKGTRLKKQAIVLLAN